jgi:hypothetical protein
MMPSKYVCIVSLILPSVLVLASWEAAGVSAQTGSWTEPVNISHTPNGSWFPDLTVDNLGNVHVVWCETTHVEGGRESEQVFYTRWDGHEWLMPNDIVAPQFFIHRNAIVVGPTGGLLMAFRKAVVGGYGIFLTSAPSEDAHLAASWSSPRLMSAHLHSYMVDMAVDSQGTIHLVFDDMGDNTDDICPGGCADIYYRRSTDDGQTWSPPLNLLRSPVGSSREQIEIDSSDIIHVTWDEGWDRLSGVGDAIYGVYTFSTDGGETWAPVASVSYPESTNAQLTVGSDGNGRVMLVWRATSRNEIFYQWSSDGGSSWGAPATIPGIFARPWTTPLDMYDMATDSAGHIHLVMVGREALGENAPLGVYHLEWDGTNWSTARRIHSDPVLYPEYPRIAISRGNQLHVVWFTRESLWGFENREVWYSSSQSAAPYQTPVPSPTPTSTPTPVPLPSPTPTITPFPTLGPSGTDLPEGLYTESDEVLRLIIALSPMMVVILLVVAVRLRWFSKLFRWVSEWTSKNRHSL